MKNFQKDYGLAVIKKEEENLSLIYLYISILIMSTKTQYIIVPIMNGKLHTIPKFPVVFTSVDFDIPTLVWNFVGGQP